VPIKVDQNPIKGKFRFLDAVCADQEWLKKLKIRVHLHDGLLIDFLPNLQQKEIYRGANHENNY
jgi:hypothetical protein